MTAKLMTIAAAILAAALFAYVAHDLIASMSAARYDAGLAAARMEAVKNSEASIARAATAGSAAQARIIDVEHGYAEQIARLTATLDKSRAEVTPYANSAAGHADCIDPERVRGIEAARAALFPAPATADGAGSVPAAAAIEDVERQHEPR